MATFGQGGLTPAVYERFSFASGDAQPAGNNFDIPAGQWAVVFCGFKTNGGDFLTYRATAGLNTRNLIAAAEDQDDFYAKYPSGFIADEGSRISVNAAGGVNFAGAFDVLIIVYNK